MEEGKELPEAEFYLFNYAEFDDKLFNEKSSTSQWRDQLVPYDQRDPSKPLAKKTKIPLWMEIEVCVRVSIYLLANVLIPLFPLILIFFRAWETIGYVVVGLVLLKILPSKFILMFIPRIDAYSSFERRNSKYSSVKIVVPKELAFIEKKTPHIVSLIPHGVAPFGITVYPFWDRFIGNVNTRWVVAKILFYIPLIDQMLKYTMKAIPASSYNIQKALEGGNHVGLVLDGIPGMFYDSGDTKEFGWIQKRKGIVKCALRAGSPIIPIYAFGHTTIFSIVKFNFLKVLENLSKRLEMSLVPFYGRFGLWMPRRDAIAICLGKPIEMPKIKEPTQDDINKHHLRLMKGYLQVFDTHKYAYGWGHKTFEIV